MLYFKALTEGLSALPRADPAVRAELDARAAREGWPALHAELARVDPATAARLPPTDAQRIQRALEVHCVDRPAAVGAAGTARGRESLGRADRHRADAVRSRGAARAIAQRFDAHARGRPGRRAAGACASASRSTPGDAVDALRRLSPGVAVPGRRDRRASAARRQASPPRASSPSGSSRGCARTPARFGRSIRWTSAHFVRSAVTDRVRAAMQ